MRIPRSFLQPPRIHATGLIEPDELGPREVGDAAQRIGLLANDDVGADADDDAAMRIVVDFRVRTRFGHRNDVPGPEARWQRRRDGRPAVSVANVFVRKTRAGALDVDIADERNRYRRQAFERTGDAAFVDRRRDVI